MLSVALPKIFKKKSFSSFSFKNPQFYHFRILGPLMKVETVFKRKMFHSQHQLEALFITFKLYLVDKKDLTQLFLETLCKYTNKI